VADDLTTTDGFASLAMTNLEIKGRTSPSGRNLMTTGKTISALAVALLSSVVATSAFADSMTMWVRASGANAAAHLVDLWNTTHPDKIELTTIPDNQMVTKLATGAGAAIGASARRAIDAEDAGRSV
jgi:hypothetical protein